MKTQLRNSSLRFLALSATLAAAINFGVHAQPNPDMTDLKLTTANRLEVFANNSEQELKYTAPEEKTVNVESLPAELSLEMFAENTGNLLKYTAPVDFEGPADQELENLANEMIGHLEYNAPVYDEFTNTFNKPVMAVMKTNTRPIVSDEVSSQEAWLINAGYYRSSAK